jgi:hypothetical protein
VERGTPVKWCLVLVALLILLVSIVRLYDSVFIWKARNYPIQEGKIIGRESSKGFSFRKLTAPCELLTIQVKETQIKVTSVLFKRYADTLPDDVKIYFDSNRKDNIVVVGQKTTWGSAIFGFGVVGIILIVYCSRNRLLALLIMRSFAKKGSYP